MRHIRLVEYARHPAPVGEIRIVLALALALAQDQQHLQTSKQLEKGDEDTS